MNVVKLHHFLLFIQVKAVISCLATSSAVAPVTEVPTEAPVTEPVTQVPTDCNSCSTTSITLETGQAGNVPTQIVPDVDANGCATAMLTCEGTPFNINDLALLTLYTGPDLEIETQNGVGTISVTITCSNNMWMQGGLQVTEVGCVVVP